MFSNLFGLRKVGDNNICFECYKLKAPFVGFSSSGNYTCKVNGSPIRDNNSCWRFLKSNGKELKFWKHLGKHWQYYITTLIIITLGILGIVL